MKLRFLLPLMLLGHVAVAQLSPNIKTGPVSKVIVQTPPVKADIKKKTDNNSGGKLHASKDLSKDLAKTGKAFHALGFLTAKKYERRLADGTKMTTRMFINNAMVRPAGSTRAMGTPRTSVKPRSKKEENSAGWNCNVEQIKVSLDDESFMNAANEQQSANLYPGAIYSFDNFFNGSFRAETAPRRPFKIITSASGVRGDVFEQVNDPSVSNIKNAVNKLFNRMPKSNAIAAYKSKIYECNSLAEQMIKLTGGGGAYGFSASFGMDMKNKSEYRNFIIDCTQEMYSVSAEMPDSSFFVNVADANKDGLMVMSNVTYGQRVLVSLTTKMTSNEFGNKFDAKYSGFGASANIGLETFTREVSDETTIKIYIVGGSNPGLIETNKNQLMSKLNEYFKSTNLQNAKPISYQFRNMNYEVVQSQSATDFFAVRKCIPAPPPGVNAADIKWKVSIKIRNIGNETDMQESIHLGLHQLVSVKGTAAPIRYENFSAGNVLGYLIYWGGYPMTGVPYEEPRTFKGNTDPAKSMSFIISQKDADDGAYLHLINNYIAMVSTRFAGKTNESTRSYDQKFMLKELLPKLSDTKFFSINFNNRVFKFQYELSAQKLD